MNRRFPGITATIPCLASAAAVLPLVSAILTRNRPFETTREMSSPVQHADDTASLAPAVASPSPHARPLELPAPVMGGTATSVAGVALSEPEASVSAGLSAPEQVALTFSSVDAEPQPAASRAISSGDATDTRATLGFMRPPAFSLESALEPLPPLGLISPVDTVQGMASTDDQATGHVLA